MQNYLVLLFVNIAFLYRYAALLFTGFFPQWEMFIQSINRLPGDKRRSQADGISRKKKG